ncbi:MAG: dihydroorotate dehydrogenase electron transfer subunit [Lachnospiraceae bacterium]|nr:dihydroorotate dehydrogenase electron transfer subunit [Lachnospiraceae bacterium]
MKIWERAGIISQECLCDGVYSMWLATDIGGTAEPGQFVSVYSNSDARLLPRPISICETGTFEGKKSIRLVYRVAGAGTKEFSKLCEGDSLDVMGPLGNGFLKAAEGRTDAGTKALLIGGGIGIPPMVELAKRLTCDVTTVAGYRSAKELFLTKELEKEGRLFAATYDGSFGTCGNVIDAIRENDIRADIIFACGPKPMLKGIKAFSEELGIPAYVSLEERMACGVGACLGCVCGSAAIDDHSKVKNKRVCVDGPVFEASEVVL